MRIILLRHESRYEDPTLLTELTPEGKNRSIKLVESLSKYPIDSIYSSPFIRTLQTIDPFSRHINKMIKVENGLYEYMVEGVFKPNNYYKLDDKIYSTIIQDDFNIDGEYSSLVCAPGQEFETEVDLVTRVDKMLNKLVGKKRDKTILLVSHMSTINAIIRRYVPDHDLDYPYPIGGIHVLEIDASAR